MEKPIYPSSNMRITQGYGEGTHKDSYAIDDAGKDTGRIRYCHRLPLCDGEKAPFPADDRQQADCRGHTAYHGKEGEGPYLRHENVQ